MRARTLLVAAVLLAAAAVVAAVALGGPLRSSEAAVVTARSEDFRVAVEATGRLEAAVAFDIGPPSVRDEWNYNLKWMIPDGSSVKAGQPILRFDTTKLDERLRKHEAQRETTVQEREKEQRNLDVSLRQLRLDLVKAEGELKKNEVELAVPEGMISKIELKKLRLERELATERVRFLREKIEFEQELVKSKLELLDVKRKRAEQLIDYVNGAREKFTVKAPIDGLIVYMPKQNGDRWEVGESVWMLAKLLKVADVSTLRVKAQVLEVDAARIRVDQLASVSIDAIPGSVLATRVGEVGRLVRERSVQDRSKVFDVYLPVDEVDDELMRPGMGIHAEIEVEVLPGSVTLPLEAIRVAEEGTYVEVVSVGAPERRTVELGARDSERVLVLSGLEAGERVLLPSRGDA